MADIRAFIDERRGAFIANDHNLGVATALNQGARKAVNDGAQWLLTLDQDTEPTADLVAQLLAAATAYPRPERVALVGAVTHGQNDVRCSDARVVRRRSVITSGSLLSLEAYQRIGPFRDDFFIDMVDAEYSLRAERRGYRVVLACQAHIEHSIGAPSQHRLFGRAVATSNHPAWRRYYLARNRIDVWRANVRYVPGWVVFDVMGHFRDTALMATFENGRGPKLRATLHGTLDGLRGRSGGTVGPDDFS